MPRVEAESGEIQRSQAAAPRGFERRLARRLMRCVGSPAWDVRLWNGEIVKTTPGRTVGVICFRDRGAFYSTLLNPGLCFGDHFAEGRIEVEGSLVSLLEEASRKENEETRRFDLAWWNRRRNTLSGSRRNIHHHYDIGNDFYRLWLDEKMVYTCAYFPEPTMTLEESQIAKMNLVGRKLRLRPGMSVVEAGCGWGALALHLAQRFDVTVRAFNISKEQIAWARKQAQEQGMADRVEFIEDDYRNIAGTCDAFVSVGMLEHVGVEHYRQLGEVVSRCLGPRGRGLIHSIGRHRPGRVNAWIARRIFPGAYPPSLSEMMQIFEPNGLCVIDVENLRLHYAQTLRAWRERYEASVHRVREMFDDNFVRAWRLYLAGSEAAFAAGRLQLYQVVFTRPGELDVPRTRAFIFDENDPADAPGATW